MFSRKFLFLSPYLHKNSSFNCQKENIRHERINSRQRQKNEAFHTNRHDFLDFPMTIHVITSRNGGRKRYYLILPAEIKSWHQPIDFSECIPITIVVLTINLRKTIHIHVQITIGDFYIDAYMYARGKSIAFVSILTEISKDSVEDSRRCVAQHPKMFAETK